MTGDNNHPLTSSLGSALIGSTHVPGDKSISHRALMLSSQVLGIATIHGLLEAEDVLCTVKALQSLGVTIERQNGFWKVYGVGIGGLKEGKDMLDMGNSGTGTRLLMGLVTPYPFTTFFTGDDSLRGRPMKRVMLPLSQMGAEFNARDNDRLPLALTGTITPKAITYELPVASAQVKSAILLAGLNTPGKTTVIEPERTRDHTENMLQHLGVVLETQMINGKNYISIEGNQKITAKDHEIHVPGDPSSAAFLIVAALICPGSGITVQNICINSLRIGLFDSLREMGAKISYANVRIVAGEKVADIEVESSRLRAISVPAERAPAMIDEYMILSVAAAFAEGETAMHGLSELRVKESDRLNSTLQALLACGVKARIENDSLYVTGGKVRGGAIVKTHYDHRIAMSFLVMGMASEQPVTVDDATAIKTSFPNFVKLMNGLGAKIVTRGESLRSNKTIDLPLAPRASPLVIAIDGPAASGKGTLARRIAEHFGLDYLDTGSLYRAVGLKLIYSGKDPSDREAAMYAAESIDDNDLTNPRLRQERIGQAASIVSAYPEVRGALLEFQRNFAKGAYSSPSPLMGEGRGGGDIFNSPHSNLPPQGGKEKTFKGAVLDGRDIGTVVYPKADFKFFITASLEARAKRRWRELSGEGIEVVFDSVLEDLRERDERDSKRAIAPLIPAPDAVSIDTSELDANSVFEYVRSIIAKK